ncbi:Diguanylate cyclase/phosphodiesterase [Paraburkholderia piptadeniae]|uniref:Diguanylate cyclase/phosphodiesterase n=1 Tax=Paraburkholderia piptadeniae TaxID=1701573 RepID=A0A1N7SQW9_9BURK|nr:bifunctional diguanylate cyclase/phosphodiesterase [Paraburkholderia piptadeniae]SIT49860.1 Diguanylate cyclase/phosphodiesterase [Paraburkholderia piptadeniae]
MLSSLTERTSDAGLQHRFHRRSLEHQRPLATMTMAFTVIVFMAFAFARCFVAGPAVPLIWRLACAACLASLVAAIARAKSISQFGALGVAYMLVLLAGLALNVDGLDVPLVWALPAMVAIPVCAAPLWLTPAHFFVGSALFCATGVPLLMSLPRAQGDANVVWWMWLAIALPTAAVFHFGFYRFRRNHFLLEDRLTRLAATDPLTGLHNRRAFLDQAALRLSKLDGEASVSAVFLDIDRFKSLNDRFGHAVGDQALSNVARVLTEMTTPADIVGRIGGEEFVLLHDAALRPAAQLAETLRIAIGRIARPDGLLSASFGVAQYRCGESVMALLDRADEALLRAKHTGRDCVCVERAAPVDPVQLTWAHDRAEGASSEPLRQLWDDFWLTSHFQPLYSLSHQKQVGFEALLRGEREDGSHVPPAVLFSPRPFSDQGDLDRTSHALHLGNARRLIPDDAWVFLNILPATFVADGYADQLAQLAGSAGLAPDRVVLELLESHGSSVDDMSRAAGQYREHGFLIAVDDFGAGHSNLDRLLRIRPDLVKLDGELIRATSPGVEQPILPKLVSLLHQAGMLVVVEGVETTEQLILAVESNVDFAQGFLLGRPSPSVTPPDAVHRRIDHAFDVIAQGRAHQHALFESEVRPYRRALDAGVDAWLKGVPLDDAFCDLAQLELCVSCFVLDETGRQIGHEVMGKASAFEGGSLHPVANPRDARWDHRPYFRNAVLRPGVPVTSSPYLSLASGRPCIAVTVALQSHEGRCVVGAELDWSLRRLPWPTAEQW